MLTTAPRVELIHARQYNIEMRQRITHIESPVLFNMAEFVSVGSSARVGEAVARQAAVAKPAA